MTRKPPFAHLILAVTLANSAYAQQSASATFAPAKASSTADRIASATLPETGGPDAQCQHIVSAPCKKKSKVSRPNGVLPKTPKAEKFDRLAIHPDVAVRDTKPSEINLPGVMKITGANAHAMDFSRARVIDVTNGGAQVVYVSAVDQNRIQLPWPNPKVVGTDELVVDKSASSNNVYVQFKPGINRGVTVSFEQPDGPSVVDLKLEPKDITGQVVIVRDSSLRSGDQKPLKAGDYVASTQGLMEQVALDGAPQGYSQSDLTVGPIAVNGLVVVPQKVYSSADRDIYLYEVLNPGPNKASLREQEFDGDNVLAISIFPKPVLAANERTKVIVITRKATGD